MAQQRMKNASEKSLIKMFAREIIQERKFFDKN